MNYKAIDHFLLSDQLYLKDNYFENNNDVKIKYNEININSESTQDDTDQNCEKILNLKKKDKFFLKMNYIY
jgi:hypothetical protein